MSSSSEPNEQPTLSFPVRVGRSVGQLVLTNERLQWTPAEANSGVRPVAILWPAIKGQIRVDWSIVQDVGLLIFTY